MNMTHTPLMLTLRQQLDHWCVKSFSEYKAEKLSPSLWWSSNQAIGGLLLDKGNMDKLTSLPVSTPWNSVAKEVNAVYDSSDIGACIYAEAHEELWNDRCMGIIDTVMNVFKASKITLNTMESSQEQFISQCTIAGIDAAALRDPWTVKVSYRALVYSVIVNSALDCFTAVRGAQVLGLGVHKGFVDKIFSEDDFILGLAPYKGQTDIDAEVCQKAQNARKAACSMIESRGLEDAVTVLAHLKTKWKLLQGLDPQWRLTWQLLNMHTGDLGDERLRAHFLRCLPAAEGVPKTIDVSLTEIATLLETKMFGYAGLGVQKVCKDLYACVEALKRSSSPQLGSESSPFMKTAMARLARFCSFQEASVEGKPGEKLVGLEAVEKQYGTFSASIANKNEDRRILGSCVAFAWLLSPEKRLQVSQWENMRLANGKKRKAETVEAAKRKNEGDDEAARAKFAALVGL